MSDVAEGSKRFEGDGGRSTVQNKSSSSYRIKLLKSRGPISMKKKNFRSEGGNTRIYNWASSMKDVRGLHRLFQYREQVVWNRARLWIKDISLDRMCHEAQAPAGGCHVRELAYFQKGIGQAQETNHIRCYYTPQVHSGPEGLSGHTTMDWKSIREDYHDQLIRILSPKGGQTLATGRHTAH